MLIALLKPSVKYSDFSDICQLIYGAGVNGRTVHVVLVLAY